MVQVYQVPWVAEHATSVSIKRSFLLGIGKRLIQPGALNAIKGGDWGLELDQLFAKGSFFALTQKTYGISQKE